MESSEICSVINDQSRGTTAKHLSSDWLHHYKFIIQFAGEKKIKIGKMVDCDHCVIIRLKLLTLKMQHSPEK